MINLIEHLTWYFIMLKEINFFINNLYLIASKLFLHEGSYKRKMNLIIWEFSHALGSYIWEIISFCFLGGNMDTSSCCEVFYVCMFFFLEMA